MNKVLLSGDPWGIPLARRWRDDRAVATQTLKERSRRYLWIKVRSWPQRSKSCRICKMWCCQNREKAFSRSMKTDRSFWLLMLAWWIIASSSAQTIVADRPHNSQLICKVKRNMSFIMRNSRNVRNTGTFKSLKCTTLVGSPVTKNLTA